MNDMLKYTVKKRSVNSESLFKEINNFIEQFLEIDGLPYQWQNSFHRESIILFIEDFLEHLKEDQGKIEQYKVVCDGRNNSEEDNKNGFINVDVSYKQHNCLNTTKLEYRIDINYQVYDDYETYFVITW